MSIPVVAANIPCPYKVPTVSEIIKRIDSVMYRIDKHQFISDVLECGAISISNAVDLVSRNEREERYKKIMEKYRIEERKLLAEVFGMIFALLSSVVYDNGRFDDYLGEIFMRCNQGNSSIVGEKRALCVAINKTDTEKRGTCLAEKIKEYFK